MTKTNKKGFTLVELIIVIAILAILIAALAPALIKYIEKSRISKDVSSLDNVYNAIRTALANEEVNSGIKNDGAWYALDNVATDNSVLDTELFGESAGTLSTKYKAATGSDDSAFVSKAAGTGAKVYYKVTADYKLEVGLGKLEGTTFTAQSADIPNIGD